MAAACEKCGTTRYVVACLCCQTPTCPDCKAGLSADVVAAPFATYCSDDCRDGTHLRTELRQVKCPTCHGKGKRYDTACWRCQGDGKVNPERAEEEPIAPEGKRLMTCPQCLGRWQLNTAMCAVCDASGVVAE